jgi:NAD(P)-dependent dehydrogenase (short-subunit alcohol dehydrogenase family)
MKTALITGGSRGIGKATAEALRALGWEVIAPGRGELDFCNINSVVTHEVDWLTSRRVPRYDAIVFCHGQWYSRSPFNLEHEKGAAWYKQFTMRVVSPAYLLNFLLASDPNCRPGCVVMVSSTRGFVGGLDTGPYAVACAAQIALMQGYAREYPGVRFNAVAPGWTDTDMGALVKATGGVSKVSNPNAQPQPAQAVADAILRLVTGDENGKVLRVVDGEVTEARWVWS